MKNRFFVMVYTPDKRHAEPIVDDNGETMFWETYEDALDVAEEHSPAIDFGFEIFEINSFHVY